MKHHSALTFLCLFVFLGSPVSADIVTRNISYASGTTELKGFLAYDDAIEGKRPGILVVHEWWGQNDYARKRATMLAKLGYVAFALDMYGDGKTADHPKDAGKFSSEVMQNLAEGRARFDAAMDVLKRQPETDPEKIAAIGYCFGGAVVLQMARFGVDLKAVASFHGNLSTTSPAVEGKVKAKVLVCNGAADTFIPEEQIAAFKKEMESAGVDYTFESYDGAVHSFTNPGATEAGKKFNLPLAYDKEADEKSWRAMQALFDDVFQ